MLIAILDVEIVENTCKPTDLDNKEQQEEADSFKAMLDQQDNLSRPFEYSQECIRLNKCNQQ